MNALLWQARGWRASDRPSMVGRLDKLTSGHRDRRENRPGACGHSTRPGREMAADKQYLALVYGRVPRFPRHDRPRSSPRSARSPAGRRRRAQARRASRGGSASERARAAPAGLALLKCRLVTGECIRFACTSRRPAGRSSATRSTANRSGATSPMRISANRCAPSRVRRCTRGGCRDRIQ